MRATDDRRRNPRSPYPIAAVNTFFRVWMSYSEEYGRYVPDADSPWGIVLACTAMRAHEAPGGPETEIELQADTLEQMVELVREVGWHLQDGHCGTDYEVEDGVEVWAACPDCETERERAQA